MTPAEVVRAAIPGASDGLVEHIVWGRTPFPCGPITTRSLYDAARRWLRAGKSGKQLCELCDRVVTPPEEWTCDRCLAAMSVSDV